MDAHRLTSDAVLSSFGRRRAVALAAAFALSLVAACMTLALGATSASAVVAHPFLSSFNGAETPAGSVEPVALAVDYSAGQSAGDVYVASGGGVVDKFSAAPGSSYLCQITGAGSATSSPNECDGFGSGAPEAPFNGANGVAIDPASGDVYIADTAHQVVDKFDSTGAYLSQITGFSYPTSLAVDASTGDLYIVDLFADEVKKYDPTTASLTTFATGTPSGSFGAAYKVAVDNSTGASAGDVYVLDRASLVVDKFDSSGTFLSQLSGPESGPFSNTNDLAVDPANGDLYVADHDAGVVDQFDATGSFLGQIAHGSMQPSALALAANGDVYVGDLSKGVVDVFGPGVVVPGVHTGEASNITATSATVEGTVNPAALPVSDCHFDYVDEADYNPSLPNPYGAGSTAPCVPDAASLPSDSEDHVVTADITGLAPGTTYHFRLQASNSNGTDEGNDATVQTLPTPVIDSAIASELTASSVKLTAKINPRGYDTHYRFEYGTSTSYGGTVPSSAEDIGSGEADVPVAQKLTGLEENRTYHWRVVAESANGVTIGPDHTFIYDTSGEGLPDKRAYEMVTPPRKNGALIGSLSLPEAASDGSRVMSLSIQCFADAESCNAQRRSGVGSPYEFTRTPAGWVTTAMSPPASLVPVSNLMGYEVNSGMAFFSAPPAATAADRLYTREPDGSFVGVGPVTPPEGGAKGPLGGFAGGGAQAYSRDLSHLAWETTPSGFWSSFDATKAVASVYEYAATGQSQPFLVGVSGGLGSTDLISECGTVLDGTNPPGMMSADGRIVYVTAIGAAGCVGTGVNAATPVEANELLARVDGEMPDAHTVVVSARSASDCSGACSTSGAGDARFMGASADGSKAVFVSTQQLTNQASEDTRSGDTAQFCHNTTGPNGCNLYLYDFANPAAERLIDLSAGDTSGGGPRVQGVLAISEDGSHVYFVAQGVLTAEGNDRGEHARNGADNLYVFERDASDPAGRVGFIADLPSSDDGQWTVAFGLPENNVTPDGRYLVFVSHGTLTADDTSRSGAQQVFRYDAVTRRLVRISIGNNGFDDNGNRSEATPCNRGVCSENALLASGWSSRRDPTMSDDGAYVFFTSPVGLTPRALNDVRLTNTSPPAYAENVYEWHEGHVSLISDGKDLGQNASPSPHCSSGAGSTEEAASAVCLLGSDASGRNVFFTSTDQLVKQDTDTALDYYDARICEPQAANPCIEAPTSPSLPCLGEACHGIPASTPGLLGPPTVSFNGQGNVAERPAGRQTRRSLTRRQKLARALKSCRGKRGKRRRVACERQARKRYGPVRRVKKANAPSIGANKRSGR